MIIANKIKNKFAVIIFFVYICIELELRTKTAFAINGSVIVNTLTVVLTIT